MLTEHQEDFSARELVNWQPFVEQEGKRLNCRELKGYIQLLSSYVIALTLLFPSGMRMISDTMDRYEKIADQYLERINELMTPIKQKIVNDFPEDVQKTNQDIKQLASRLIKHGRYLLTTLYPKPTIDDIETLTDDIEEYGVFLKKLSDENEEPLRIPHSVFFELLGSEVKAYDLIRKSSVQRKAKKLIDGILSNENKTAWVIKWKTLKDHNIEKVDKLSDELREFLQTNT